MRVVKDLLEIELIILFNIYLKYYLMVDEIVEYVNLNYIRVNEIMDRREKDIFEECERIIKNGIVRDIWFDVSEYF